MRGALIRQLHGVVAISTQRGIGGLWYMYDTLIHSYLLALRLANVPGFMPFSIRSCSFHKM
jgi:hypothetical protein